MKKKRLSFWMAFLGCLSIFLTPGHKLLAEKRNSATKREGTSPEKAKKQKRPKEESIFVTDDNLEIQMIGGIISRKGTDFFERAKNPKSVILIKKEGSLKAYKVSQSFESKYKSKRTTFTLHHLYNKYHMMLSYKEGMKTKYLEVVRVGFSSKRANIPKKPKKAKPIKKLFSGKYSENGFERDFDGTSGKIKMTEGYREDIKKNLSKILMHASTEAVVEHEEIIGFVIDDIEPDSMFEKAGLQNEDIITSINGRPLTNAATAIKILHTLKETEEIDFEFRRKGDSYSVSVDVQ